MEHPSLIQEATIRPLVEAFYERVRSDPLLAPVFGAHVHDWGDHHARLADFWSSIMLTTGRYKGSPLALHLMHADEMTRERFDRWLELWRETSDELLPAPVAAAVQAKAARIAESFQLAIKYRSPGAMPPPRTAGAASTSSTRTYPSV
ncbi:hemoglobin [Novosphingobium chloroacetimidivorans]|uniref:Hemoglobin n=1 Tax=Novosphingobium chloroacetimidivorans TaxID=1428314 RepID=A0A7W7KAM0_9SPHN|nr:group III truncated hemoglobin [Novosphingobium chloroacetimidivorans]MBB4859307.1 hemoglobin [Novosphingobium chloroacetimidivorans]